MIRRLIPRSPSRAVVALVVALGSCTGVIGPDPLPSARAFGESFFAAWSSQDETRMIELMSSTPARDWSETSLERFFADVRRAGSLHGFTVERAGPVIQPSPEAAAPATTVPFRIVYRSDALGDEATMEGDLPVTLDAGSDSWRAEWDRALMWPGIDGAAGFRVVRRWPRRGPIVDRNGRALARGTAERRRYPQGSLAGSTVGHLGRLGRREKRDLSDHRRGDLVGASGLEAAYEDRLAGSPRTRLIVVDSAGDELRALGGAPARRGRRLRATLDVRVQRAATRAFGATVGGAVVLDPATGDLLAAVTSGEFGPGNYVGATGVEPFNRALSGLYPPGSSLKVMTAAAGLDSGKVKASTPVTGPAEYMGVRNFESGTFGRIDVARALKFSVNTAFAQIAEKIGGTTLTRYARAFGFNRPVLMRLQAGTSSFPPPEDLSDLMWGSIGQAQVLATPLQMASIAATVANDGLRMEPRGAFDRTERGRRVIKRRVARTMTRLMENVVQGGTGTGARISGVRVAGKTGTAEVDVGAERRNHAWFIAFAPAGTPKVAIAVVAEYGGVGGQVAAPIARRILTSVLPLVD